MPLAAAGGRRHRRTWFSLAAATPPERDNRAFVNNHVIHRPESWVCNKQTCNQAQVATR
jgi:hypothetical protein